MITSKIFKVKEVTQRDGEKYYKVYGYDNKLGYFLGVDSFCGSKENKTFSEALDQIDTLINCSVYSIKTIHVVFSDDVLSRKHKKESINN